VARPAPITREVFRRTRAAEDASLSSEELVSALAARVERYEDALWEVMELARDQQQLIEHRRSQKESVSDVDVGCWLALRKASKKAMAALGLDPTQV